eukprot:TRINITY_DN2762_c0_g1_i1.p1 TRINITY_DN2762_c0_g1~~TRINITY_DN2762_c0_g1_i1.p1  ORF type:complete len:730 (-),score=202.07 TRINITY_DN2762_c0_g1_i1:98-2098(-)
MVAQALARHAEAPGLPSPPPPVASRERAGVEEDEPAKAAADDSFVETLRQKLVEASKKLGGGRKLFRCADRDGSGKIDVMEFDRLCKFAQPPAGWSESESRELFGLLDTNSSGLIEREELAAWLDRAAGELDYKSFIAGTEPPPLPSDPFREETADETSKSVMPEMPPPPPPAERQSAEDEETGGKSTMPELPPPPVERHSAEEDLEDESKSVMPDIPPPPAERRSAEDEEAEVSSKSIMPELPPPPAERSSADEEEIEDQGKSVLPLDLSVALPAGTVMESARTDASFEEKVVGEISGSVVDDISGAAVLGVHFEDEVLRRQLMHRDTTDFQVLDDEEDVREYVTKLLDSQKVPAGEPAEEEFLEDEHSSAQGLAEEQAVSASEGRTSRSASAGRHRPSRGWIAGLEGIEGGTVTTEELVPFRPTFSGHFEARRPSAQTPPGTAASGGSSPSQPKLPAGSGASFVAAARRLREETIEGMLRKHTEENKQLEALLQKKYHNPSPGTKLPQVNSLPVIPMDRDKAMAEAKRTICVSYHRVVSPPASYHVYKQKPAMDLDLHDEELRLHADPKLQEKRFRRQRATYQSVPVNLTKGRTEVTVSPQLKGASKKSKPPRSRSSPLLPPAAGATMAEDERRPPKQRSRPQGADMLKMLAHGALPSLLCRPV